jgi:peptidoglycan/xylan/chitin deacetylase (PgdA/CDA1 family)
MTIRPTVNILGLCLLMFSAVGTASPCTGSVYLTLDVGNMVKARQIADTLKREDIKATFFLANNPTYRGDHVLDKSWGDFWRARVAEGHAFGNHTWHHYWERRDLNDGRLLVVDRAGRYHRLTKSAFCREFSRVDHTFHQLTGRHVGVFWRAPGGRTTQRSVRWAASCGYPVLVGWQDAGFVGDELPSDKYPNEMLLKRALKNIQAGDVILMHLGIHSRKQPLADILGPLIRGLKSRGLCFKTLDVSGN